MVSRVDWVGGCVWVGGQGAGLSVIVWGVVGAVVRVGWEGVVGGVGGYAGWGW